MCLRLFLSCRYCTSLCKLYVNIATLCTVTPLSIIDHQYNKCQKLLPTFEFISCILNIPVICFVCSLLVKRTPRSVGYRPDCEWITENAFQPFLACNATFIQLGFNSLLTSHVYKRMHADVFSGLHKPPQKTKAHRFVFLRESGQLF